jgi:uncharacterized protein YlxW (UPF0749 family)
MAAKDALAREKSQEVEKRVGPLVGRTGTLEAQVASLQSQVASLSAQIATINSRLATPTFTSASFGVSGFGGPQVGAAAAHVHGGSGNGNAYIIHGTVTI